MIARSRLMPSSRIPVIVLAALLLGACGDTQGERIAGGTLMGAGLGAAGGPIGVVVGAGVGAAAGTFTPKGVLEGEPQQGGH